MIRDRAHAYFREFMASVPGDVTAFASRKKQLILPTIPINFVVNLTEEVTNIIKNEPSLLDIKSPVTVAGDLHGHLLDLFRILKTFGSPEARQYLFLGDIVDRGEFSVETIILIYIMKVVWPKKFILFAEITNLDICAVSAVFFRKSLSATAISEFFAVSLSHLVICLSGL